MPGMLAVLIPPHPRATGLSAPPFAIWGAQATAVRARFSGKAAGWVGSASQVPSLVPPLAPTPTSLYTTPNQLP